MLSLLAVLPREIDDEVSLLLVLTSVNALDSLLPASARRFPFNSFGAGRRGAVGRVNAVLTGTLRRGGIGGRGLRAAALLRLQSLLGVLENLLPAADALVVLVEDVAGVLPKRYQVSLSILLNQGEPRT